MTDDDLLRRPVIVLGAPRSGTSLLSQLLRRHPDVTLANEPRILWKWGNDARSDALRPKHARPDVVSHLRREFANQVRTADKTRLLEKTPSNALRVGFVDAVFPDAVYLHVIRDGAESVLSIKSFWENHATGVPSRMLWQRLREMSPRQAPHYAREFLRRVMHRGKASGGPPPVWGPRPPGIDPMRRDLDLVEVCAWQWRMCVEHACTEGRLLPPDRYTEVRLGDLSEEVLERLVRFAGLPPSDEVRDAFRERFDASQPNRRSRAADDGQLERVARLVAPTEKWLASEPLVERH